MQKLLIAQAAEEFAEAAVKQLKGAYTIKVCSDADRAMELIHSFEPDILLLDIMLRGGDGMAVLHALRTTGRSAHAVVITANRQPYVLNSLRQLGVSNVFLKPCKTSEVVACIHALSTGAAESAAWFVESETDLILLRLGFRMGPARYGCVYHSILARYHFPQSSVTKQLYPQIAHICGGSAARVEKAIRDAIHEAWKHGDKHTWLLYFPSGKGGVLNCPSNEVFISRIAAALHHRARICPPGELPENKAQ